ncbi:hypothetical protein PRIPAC_79974 [Pristionchus pacificus]|nr:hypothetical protein PRIPAC_79974 [Pristionchus pacificus]
MKFSQWKPLFLPSTRYNQESTLLKLMKLSSSRPIEFRRKTDVIEKRTALRDTQYSGNGKSFNDYTSLQKSLKVSFDKLLSRQIQNPANLDEIIETRRNLFHRVKAKHVQLEMINFSLFPLDKIEEILGDVEFDSLTVIIRGAEADPGFLDLIRRHETKEITVEMEDSLLNVSSLLSLSRCSITASWLSGFRGIWEDENALSESDFLDLLKKKHCWLHLPVKFEKNGQAILEAIKEVSKSDVEQRVTLRIEPLMCKQFCKFAGLRMADDGQISKTNKSEFTIDGRTIRYGEARIGIMKCYTRKYAGPGAMTYFMISIIRSFEE